MSHPRPTTETSQSNQGSQVTADPARLAEILIRRLSDEIHRSVTLEAGLAEALANQREQARLLTDGARMVRDLFRANANVTDGPADQLGPLQRAVERLGKWHLELTDQAPDVAEPAE